MKALRVIVSVCLLAAVGFAQDIRYNFASGQDFSKYKTYKWVRIKGAEQLNQIADEQLKAAVDAQLANKGLARTESEKADLFLAYQVSLNQEKEFNSFSSNWGYGPGWGYGWYGGGGMSTTSGSTSTIQVGQVDLDMYDSANQKLVWRGTASKTLDTKAKPDKRQKNISKAMAKLLKNYPPPPKKG